MAEWEQILKDRINEDKGTLALDEVVKLYFKPDYEEDIYILKKRLRSLFRENRAYFAGDYVAADKISAVLKDYKKRFDSLLINAQIGQSQEPEKADKPAPNPASFTAAENPEKQMLTHEQAIKYALDLLRCKGMNKTFDLAYFRHFCQINELSEINDPKKYVAQETIEEFTEKYKVERHRYFPNTAKQS
jgi:hypothetical protein